jgi:signal transduction histidine kinase
MDREMNTPDLLDLMVSPGFCVKEGKIVKCNASALGLLIREGTEITSMLATGAAEYAEFTGGCLHLMLNVSGVMVGTSVTRMGDGDVFILEEESEQAELQAIALAARELREPLTGILLAADRLFPMTAALEDPAMQEQMTRMNRGLYQLLRIVGNMSDAGRYSASPAAQQETVDICAVMQEIFDKARELTSHAGISLDFENLNYSLYCLADREKLERAILNILSNAIKFTPAGGKISAKLTRKGSHLYLTVQDNGEGVPDSIRNSIHRRWQRQPAIEDPRFGIGLGMVLIRSAAASHGGAVLIDHPEGAGTRITMTLAIRQDASGTVRSPLLRPDYAGERDHGLIELADILPAELFKI